MVLWRPNQFENDKIIKPVQESCWKILELQQPQGWHLEEHLLISSSFDPSLNLEKTCLTLL